MANIKDGATSLIQTAPSPATSGVNFTVTPGDGALFPTPPFYAIMHPQNLLPIVAVAEKVLVTGISTDTFTVVRAQAPYTAKTVVGSGAWRISNALFTSDLFTSSQNPPEILGGTPNGALTTFTTSQAYTSITLFKTGTYMYPGIDYTYSGTTVTFLTGQIPATGSRLVAIGIVGSQLMISGSNSLPTDETPTGTKNGVNTSFNVGHAYVSGTLEYFVNGYKQKRGIHFFETSPSTGAFTTSDAPLATDDIMTNSQLAQSITGNAQSVNGYGASPSPTANTIPVLDANGRLPASTITYPVSWVTPTLSSGWAAFQTTTLPTTLQGQFGYPRYHKDALGYVHITGLALNNGGNNATASVRQAIFTLPAGFRPSHTLRMTATASYAGTDGWAEVDIETNGVVQLTGSTFVANNGWISLNNFHFISEQ